jgi:uncharacterized Zn-binding protein involved in type VI secretion
MPTVFANGRSVMHRGDGVSHISAAPDVCKTPSPGGPVPIPYVNVAQNAALAQGSTTVKVEGKSAGIMGSNLSVSSGDEAGTAGGGVVSGTIKGKATWGSASFDVKIEGKGTARFLDVVKHNGSSPNTASAAMGSAGGF